MLISWEIGLAQLPFISYAPPTRKRLSLQIHSMGCLIGAITFSS
jgi:hypothetical protein